MKNDGYALDNVVVVEVVLIVVILVVVVTLLIKRVTVSENNCPGVGDIRVKRW